ncbi:MAG: hypothetical protein AAFY31_11845 [Pseudomonadota bacterium]
MPIHFEQVAPTEAQIDLLYNLLAAREHTISHLKCPDRSRHREFVVSHPYRAWHIVKSDDHACGSFYLSQMNEIGINLIDHQSKKTVSGVLEFIEANYDPLKPIPSVRGHGFFINVPSSNKELTQILDTLGHTPIQQTFKLNSRED